MTLIHELKSRAIKQFVDAAEARKKMLKVETIYFNDPIAGVTHYTRMPFTHNGQIMPFTNLRGYSILQMLSEVEKGNIYGWIEYNGSRCKIKPKKIGK